MLIRGKYQGASFFELLEVDFPHLRPNVNLRDAVDASALLDACRTARPCSRCASPTAC